MNNKIRVELGDLSPHLDGYWVEMAVPALLPYKEYKDLWERGVLLGVQPDINHKGVTRKDVNQYWQSVGRKRLCRHILAWNIGDEDGNVYPLPSDQPGIIDELPSIVVTCATQWLLEQVANDEDDLGKALVAGRQQESEPQEEEDTES